MEQIRKLIKKVPGVEIGAKKAKNLFQFYEYRIALSRIEKTKEKVLHRHINNPDKKILVAFIIQYVPSWNKLKPIYDKLTKNNEFEVMLLCVPSWLNDTRIVNTEKNTNDTFDYLNNHGYKCINAYNDGKWFDLKKYKPDFVFHSRPYNHFMPEQYTSSVISQYALICSVLYAASFTYNALEVTLNEDYFKDVFCYFAIDRFEVDFYKNKYCIGMKRGIQKCYLCGATGLEQILSSKSERESSTYKNTVIWTPRWSTDPHVGGSNFFRYKDTIISLIEKHKDVKFIIRPHPLMFGNFIKTREMTEQEVTDFKSFCNVTENVSLDEQKEYSDTFWQSDFLITDASSIVPEYYVTNKPIIYCDSEVDFKYLEYVKELFEYSYVVNDSVELIKAFDLLNNSNDYKIEGRKKSITEIFGNVEEASNEIVKILKNEIRKTIVKLP